MSAPATMEDELEALLEESPQEAAGRAARALGVLTGRDDGPFVLFGAGNLGRRVAAVLRSRGESVLAFADNNPRAWGTVTDGVDVLSPADVVRRHPDATFVVTIWRAANDHWYVNTREQLRAAGARRIAPFGVLAWRYAGDLLPYLGMDHPRQVLAQAPVVREAWAALADDRSRREFLAQLRWRLRLDYDGLIRPDAPERQYFEPSIFRPDPHEVFVDCGAYTGDTLDGLLRFSGGTLERAWLSEPDPLNFAKLQSHAGALRADLRARVTTSPMAVGASRGHITIDATGTPASAVGRGSTEVEVVALDELDLPATFIKMDIEGAELDALRGAERTIRTHAPLLAIASYHRQDHLWRVPAMLKRLSPDHRVFLRPYAQECFELVCYAVPPSRLAEVA